MTATAEPPPSPAAVLEARPPRGPPPLASPTGANGNIVNNNNGSGYMRGNSFQKRPTMAPPGPFGTSNSIVGGTVFSGVVSEPSGTVGGGGADSEDDPRVVYVGHLPPNADEHALYFAFSQIGAVTQIQVTVTSA